MDRAVKRSLLVLLVTLVVIPLQLLNLGAAEAQKAYWCSEAHFYEVRCQAAESAVTGGIAVLAVAGLALLVSLGVLLDRLILPGGVEASSG